MNQILEYLLGYACFLLGSILFLLSKVKDYKALADMNPNIEFSMKMFLRKEWVNLTQLLVGGIALVVFFPMMIGGTSVDIKNSSGSVITSVAIKTILMPMYFLVAYSGNSALFSLFGKYKKTLFNQAGVEDEKTSDN